MNYWLYITNSENWKVTRQTNILGASTRYRNALSRMQIGDKCLVYVISSQSKGAQIVGEYRVGSNVFESRTEIFRSPNYVPGEVYSMRLKLDPVKVFKDPIDFKPLISHLIFIKNKQRYQLHLRGRAIVRIPKEDYALIVSRTKEG